MSPTGADPGFLKGGVHLRSTMGGGPGGSNFGPNVNTPTSWDKRGGGPPAGADLGILRGGGGGSGPEFFKGGLGSRSAGIFIY